MLLAPEFMIWKISMLFSALGATFRTLWAKIRGFRALCTPREEAIRFDKCAECPFLTESLQCQVCGCFVELKVKLTAEKCPKGKWKSIWKKKFRQKLRSKNTI